MTSRKISTLEFKRLLFDIRDRRPDVRVRLRLLGKMWGESFCSVESVTDAEAYLLDSYKQLRTKLSNFTEVVQFELECSFFGYHAFYHYQVIGSEVNERNVTQHDFQNNGSFPNNQ